ncbi:hypothetical protein M501DRAFT_1021205 [Patellaria atrata CBS 101060]|uniref:Uncharacterized protein n=1 Tax=Patellaria atrata CBS 101060 TaxID=1346257 RepID=A0A9P4SHZ5_9PEZI|nr:hypothetical protein M501DRAFT_1021205 [Patellaria atrata CBS 101060]
MYGSLPKKIVGVHCYKSHATVGEMVMLSREPHNRYDSNAIQVQNVRREQVGHIPRDVATRLAKYMDRNELLVERCITGEMGHFECSIMLKLFGPNDPIVRAELKSRMQADRLPLNDLNNRIRDEAEREKERLKQLAAIQKNRTMAGNGGRQFAANPDSQYAPGISHDPSVNDFLPSNHLIGSSQGLGSVQNLDNIIQGKFGNGEDILSKLPMANQPEATEAELYPFQRQGLQWMLDRENPQLPATSKDTVQLYKPVLASGGILVDDMGLGKTVQMISLIMADRAIGPKVVTDVSNATLILAPLSVMSNWSSQIARHVKSSHALRVLMYHDTKKQTLDLKKIKNFDVIITTYESVASEYWNKGAHNKIPTKTGVFSIKWRRLVLDDGHNIRSPQAKKAIAASSLLAHSRWLLTGTPIINSLKDLFSLVKFLRLSGGLEGFDLFKTALMRPVNQGDERGNKLLQLLMGSICLRRKKDMKFIDLRLSEISEYLHKINFLPHEQEKYKGLEAEAKGTLATYQRGEGEDSTFTHLLDILLRMRQVCNHWKLCGEKRIADLMSLLKKQQTVGLTPENIVALQDMLTLSIESQDDCPVCLDPLKEPVITCCAHVFCAPCLEGVIETQHKCPMCRAELPAFFTHTVKPRPECPEQEEETSDIDTETSSSKVEALMSVLKASQDNKGTKTVVFSQWTKFLNMVEPHLTDAGIIFTRIDGTMPPVARDSAINSLETDEKCTVMLASLSVCSVGLNLIAANQVVLADSWWAPAIEDQAVDRVHRLGQKRECRVFRLVVEGSIEEKVLQIQEDKRKLMALAFSEKEESRKKGKTARLADVQRFLAR